MSYPQSNIETVHILQELKSLEIEFIRKSLACTKAADAETFFELSRKASEASEKMNDSLRIESCWVYLSFIKNFKYPDAYAEYCEFCARNNLVAVNEQDYGTALSFI
jgi:hypothetical protein